jgi:hypothetical protein
MDLARFISLLQKSSLYFPSVSQLAMADPYEGRFPYQQAVAMADPKSWVLPENPGEKFTEEQRANIIAQVARTFIPQRESEALFHTYVSCWHANQAESDAMWRLYSLQGQGIAVRTTFKRLREALDKEPKEICAGRVKYIDYGWHSIEMQDGMYVVFHKRESFAHEQEVRLAYQIPEGERKAVGQAFTPYVDLNDLIEQILVSPAAPAWTVDVVAELVARFGFRGTLVSQSPLYRPRLPLPTV